MKVFLTFIWTILLVSAVSADVSHGYHYNPDYNSGSNLLAAPPPVTSTSYYPIASGAPPPQPSQSFGSINFLAPDYNVAGISSASASSSSSASSAGSSSFSSSGSSAGIGFSSGNSNSGASSYNVGAPAGIGFTSGGGSFDGGAGFSQGGGIAFGQSSAGGGAIGQGNIGGAIADNQQYAQQYQEQAPIITKHFYVHSAPEDHDNQEIVRYITIGRPTTNYRVVFINAPSSTSTKAKIIAKVAPVQERTAIYLLSKKTNDLDISADVVTPAPAAQNKPDVYFIKYNTPEEAIHAQHVIQAQYDKLGGSSDFSNQANVPVQSVIGSVGGQSNASSSSSSSAQSSSQVTGFSSGQNQIQQSGGSIQQGGGIPQVGSIQPVLPATYLPPTVYRRRRYYRY